VRVEIVKVIMTVFFGQLTSQKVEEIALSATGALRFIFVI
jgi:hypothetical protein